MATVGQCTRCVIKELNPASRNAAYSSFGTKELMFMLKTMFNSYTEDYCQSEHMG